MRAVALSVLMVAVLLPACRASEVRGPSAKDRPQGTVNLLSPEWQGFAISYSGYRENQSPASGVRPSQDQIEEDLRILEKNWRMIRVYGADEYSEDVLKVIRREKIDLAVMLGIWLAREPGAEEANAGQIENGIRLANEYEDVVVAVNVGNEVLIGWTEHPVPEARVIPYVRQVKAGVKQPVTVADNYVWWRDDGAQLAREVDFITMHTYPMWERRDIDEGLSYTIENYEQVRAAHPDKPIVIGEAGWASYSEGNLHVLRAGDEQKQLRYYRELMDWARENKITVFFFSAFDEPWKGTGTEGHWGLFSVDRKAKLVMRELFPELKPDGPTSPSYPEHIAAYGPDIASVLRAGFAEIVQGGNVNPMGPGLSVSRVVSVEEADGGDALSLVFNGRSWGGFYVYLGKHDARDAGVLAMRVKLPDAVTKLELKLEGPESVGQTVNLIDFATERDETGWRTFTVPLSEFGRIDLSQVALVGLWNPSDRSAALVSGEVVVDDIRFE